MGGERHHNTSRRLDPTGKTAWWGTVARPGGDTVFSGNTPAHQASLLTPGRENEAGTSVARLEKVQDYEDTVIRNVSFSNRRLADAPDLRHHRREDGHLLEGHQISLPLSPSVPCQDHLLGKSFFFVYYESIKRELNKRLIFECRCDSRLKAKAEGSTRLAYTRWREEP